MRIPWPQTTFAPVDLRDGEKQAMQVLVSTLVNQTMKEYKESNHLNVNGNVDLNQWKQVKRHEKVAVYKQRPSKDQGVKSAQAPSLLCVGTLTGSLDDVMYGSLSHRGDIMRIRMAYVKDQVVDSAILARVVDPTADLPYETMLIKWSVADIPPMLRYMIRYRDFVYVEATGVVENDAGERVGYHVVHSVEFPGCPPFNSRYVVRGKVSYCCIYHETNDGAVDVFLKAYYDPQAFHSMSLSIQSAANVALSVTRNVKCAKRKKMQWFLNQPSLLTKLRSKPESFCKHKKSKTTFRQCSLCGISVCSNCSVLKTMHSIAKPKHIASDSATAFCLSKNKVSTTVMAFCTVCIARVNRINALSIASMEATQGTSQSSSSMALSGFATAPTSSLLSPVAATASIMDEFDHWTQHEASISSVAQGFNSTSISFVVLDDEIDPSSSICDPPSSITPQVPPKARTGTSLSFKNGQLLRCS